MSDWIEYDSNLPLEYKPLTTKPYYKKVNYELQAIEEFGK